MYMYMYSGGVLSPKGYGPNRRRGLGHPADDPGSFWGCPPCLCGVWCLRPASTRPRITDARRDVHYVSRLLRLIPGYIKAGGLKPPDQTPLQPDHSTTPSSQTSNPDPSSTGSERICGPHMAGPIPGYQFDGFPSWEYRPTMWGHPEREKARVPTPRSDARTIMT